MLQNGVITGYMVKCMKYCEFMRWINLNETADCVRVPAENTTTFVEKAISPADTSAELKGLAAYTRYHVAICAKTIKSFGPCLERIYQTDEGGLYGILQSRFCHRLALSVIPEVCLTDLFPTYRRSAVPVFRNGTGGGERNRLVLFTA